MKSSSIVKVSLVVVLALVVVGLGGPTSGRAAASLGNSGVPVRCFTPGAGVTAGNSAFFTCYAADGTGFSGNQRVPPGYYLAVTDVLVSPRAGAALSGVTEISLFDAYGTASRQSQFYLRSAETSTYGHTFAVPYLVLRPDHRLEVVAAGFNAYSVDVRITGVLVTNLQWLPMVLRNP